MGMSCASVPERDFSRGPSWAPRLQFWGAPSWAHEGTWFYRNTCFRLRVFRRQHTDHQGWQTRHASFGKHFWWGYQEKILLSVMMRKVRILVRSWLCRHSIICFHQHLKVTSEVLTLITAHFPLTPYSHSTTSEAGSPGSCISKFNWSHMSWGSICFKIWGVVSDTNVRNKKQMVTSSSETTGLRATYTPRSKWT